MCSFLLFLRSIGVSKNQLSNGVGGSAIPTPALGGRRPANEHRSSRGSNSSALPQGRPIALILYNTRFECRLCAVASKAFRLMLCLQCKDIRGNILGFYDARQS